MKYKSRLTIEAIKHTTKNKFLILGLMIGDKTFKMCEWDDYETATLMFEAGGGQGYNLTVRIGEYLVKKGNEYFTMLANKFEDEYELEYQPGSSDSDFAGVQWPKQHRSEVNDKFFKDYPPPPSLTATEVLKRDEDQRKEIKAEDWREANRIFKDIQGKMVKKHDDDVMKAMKGEKTEDKIVPIHETVGVDYATRQAKMWPTKPGPEHLVP